MKKKLTILTNGDAYLTSDPYQSQLHGRLRREHDCQYVTLDEIGHVRPANDAVFVALRFRNVVSNSRAIDRWLDGRHAVVQDYDPWVFLEDVSVHRGGYERVANDIKNVSFAVPNVYWSSIIEKRTNRRVHTFQLGMSPELCDATPWDKRTHRLEFLGAAYPIRVSCFEKLTKYIPVVWNRTKIAPYSEFLSHISALRVWAQDESAPIIVDGVSHVRNWLWPKAIEIISRGCFLIRDRHDEAMNYGLSEVPTVFLYDDVSETPEMLDKIESMASSERGDRIEQAVAWVKQRDFYGSICRQMNDWW